MRKARGAVCAPRFCCMENRLLAEGAGVGNGREVDGDGVGAGFCYGDVGAFVGNVVEGAAEVDVPSVVSAELEFAFTEGNGAGPHEEVLGGSEGGGSVPTVGGSATDDAEGFDVVEAVGEDSDVGLNVVEAIDFC